jgi:hypothetical protein
LVDEMFTSGTVTSSGGNTFINASLANGGTTLIEDKAGHFSSNSIVTSQVTAVPEPSTLTTLGFGVGFGILGLWFAGREHFRTA